MNKSNLDYNLQLLNVLNATIGYEYFKEVDVIDDLFQEILIKKDNFYIREGEVPKNIAFIVEGLVKFYYLDKKGHQWIKHIACENEFIAAYGDFLHQKPAMYYIEVIEDARLLILSREKYMKLVEDTKVWSDIARKFTEHIYYMKELREASFLKMNATERYLNFLEQYKYLVNRINVKDIASFLGISHVSLSRIRANIRN